MAAIGIEAMVVCYRYSLGVLLLTMTCLRVVSDSVDQHYR